MLEWTWGGKLILNEGTELSRFQIPTYCRETTTWATRFLSVLSVLLRESITGRRLKPPYSQRYVYPLMACRQYGLKQRPTDHESSTLIAPRRGSFLLELSKFCMTFYNFRKNMNRSYTRRGGRLKGSYQKTNVFVL